MSCRLISLSFPQTRHQKTVSDFIIEYLSERYDPFGVIISADEAVSVICSLEDTEFWSCIKSIYSEKVTQVPLKLNCGIVLSPGIQQTLKEYIVDERNELFVWKKIVKLMDNHELENVRNNLSQLSSSDPRAQNKIFDTEYMQSLMDIVIAEQKNQDNLSRKIQLDKKEIFGTPNNIRFIRSIYNFRNFFLIQHDYHIKNLFITINNSYRRSGARSSDKKERNFLNELMIPGSTVLAAIINQVGQYIREEKAKENSVAIHKEETARLKAELEKRNTETMFIYGIISVAMISMIGIILSKK